MAGPTTSLTVFNPFKTLYYAVKGKNKEEKKTLALLEKLSTELFLKVLDRLPYSDWLSLGCASKPLREKVTQRFLERQKLVTMNTVSFKKDLKSGVQLSTYYPYQIVYSLGVKEFKKIPWMQLNVVLDPKNPRFNLELFKEGSVLRGVDGDGKHWIAFKYTHNTTHGDDKKIYSVQGHMVLVEEKTNLKIDERKWTALKLNPDKDWVNLERTLEGCNEKKHNEFVWKYVVNLLQGNASNHYESKGKGNPYIGKTDKPHFILSQ